jgi:hypothetical protein
LPFGTTLEQVCESLGRPEMRGHASSFEKRMFAKAADFAQLFGLAYDSEQIVR